MSALRVSADGGATWQPLMAADDSDYLRYIQLVPSDPQQLYVRSLSSAGSSFSYSVLHSRDGGKTWQRSPVEITDAETDFALLAVSPTEPELVVAKAEAENPGQQAERLLVSQDGGKTFESPLSLKVINTAAFSADGKTLWVGSDDGLFTSTDSGKTFARVGTAEYIDTLYDASGTLLVGGYWMGAAAGMPGVGVSSDGGATLQPWMGLKQVTHPAACDPSTKTAALCATLWPDWEREILGILDTGAAGGAALAAGSGSALPSSSGAGSRARPAAGSGGAVGGPSLVPTVGTAGANAPTTPSPQSSGCSVRPGSAVTGRAGWFCTWLLLLGWLVHRTPQSMKRETKPTANRAVSRASGGRV
jgi:hypothetical protein